MPDFSILIPARLESTRLPRKALADINGAPLVARVWQRAITCGAKRVCVVTDHTDIANVILNLGGEVVMSDPHHASGTDRIAQAIGTMGLSDDEVIVNLQGDEPLMPQACVRQVASMLHAQPDAHMATLYDVCSLVQWGDPNVVKLLTTHTGVALAFSRSPIPYQRNGTWPKSIAKRHVGLYAYRVHALNAWGSLPQSAIETAESLEQWRALSAGWHIVCAQADAPVPAGVDSIEDLERVRDAFVSYG
jgi:3-deoxy-manno-octulosonate cytidylyltransferase (CMP-KDO synthetase)